MRGPTQLLPARFLLLVSHFVLVVTLLWSRSPNVRASLDEIHSSEAFDNKDTEFIVALSLSLGCFAVELFGFLGGASMFNSTAGLLSIVAHASATIALSFFVVDALPSDDFWFVFAFCSLLPALYELGVIFAVYVRKVNY